MLDKKSKIICHILFSFFPVSVECVVSTPGGEHQREGGVYPRHWGLPPVTRGIRGSYRDMVHNN